MCSCSPSRKLADLETKALWVRMSRKVLDSQDAGGCHHCGVQDVGITFGGFRQEWLVFCKVEGGGWRSWGWGPQAAQVKHCLGALYPEVHCKCSAHLSCLVLKAFASRARRTQGRDMQQE